MKLKNLSYKSKDLSESIGWQLEQIDLNTFNFIVGKNATGKTKLLIEIEIFLLFFTKGIKNSSFFYEELSDDEESSIHEEWRAVFELSNLSILTIYLITENSTIVREEVWIDSKLIIERNKNNAKIYSFNNKRFLEFSPPDDELAIRLRRDVKEYPFFEEIFKFSKGMEVFGFSHVEIEYTDSTSNPAKIFPQLGISARGRVINDMQRLGYRILDIIPEKMTSGNWDISIKEKGVIAPLSVDALSNGMLRSLALICYVELLLEKHQTTILFVDDLGEGLDYERATKLGKLLVEKLENSNIQFIATSNDSFLMDVIPIKYWNILQRDGNTVRALNYHNSKEQFDNFKFTGLSNFDLFSSDYLMRPKP
jgi:AAA15 family ATPase/GTPase